jgi:hypothetical protein
MGSVPFRPVINRELQIIYGFLVGECGLDNCSHIVILTAGVDGHAILVQWMVGLYPLTSALLEDRVRGRWPMWDNLTIRGAKGQEE